MDKNYQLNRYNDLQYLSCPTLSQFDFTVHGFAARLGGVSQGALSSLNMSRREADSPENIRQNRHRFCQAVDIPYESLFLVKQVHSQRVLIVDNALFEAGKVNPIEADAMVTNLPNIALGILTADCLPVILIHSRAKAVGAVHAGWRGSAQLIAQEAVRAMLDCYGGRAEDIYACLGPCIGPECYEVGEEVADVFRRQSPKWQDYLSRNERGWRLDLAQANLVQLTRMGVPAGNINLIRLCTSCRQDLFFSHRGSGGQAGRQMNVVMIKG